MDNHIHSARVSWESRSVDLDVSFPGKSTRIAKLKGREKERRDADVVLKITGKDWAPSRISNRYARNSDPLLIDH